MKTSPSQLIKAAITLGLVTGAAVTHAQDLSKEITADREIVPELAPASRLTVYPAAMRPDFKPVNLAPATTASLTRYTPVAAHFEPAFSARAAALTPYRGYVDAGYYPNTDFVVSAGYAAVSRPDMALDIWLNASNGEVGVRQPALSVLPQSIIDGPFKFLDIAGGVNFTNSFATGDLALSTDIAYSNFTRALTVKNQTTLAWNLSAGWSGHGANGLEYNAAARFGIFRFGRPSFFSTVDSPADASGPGLQILDTPLKANRETSFGLGLGASLPAGDNGRFGLDVDAAFTGINRFMQPDATPSATDMALGANDRLDLILAAGGKTYGIATFTPYYRLSTGSLNARAGARLDLNINCGKVIHVAPDVTVAYDPSALFGARLGLGGGEVANTMAELYATSAFTSPMFAYNPSNIPITAELALKTTPVGGLTIEAGAAYANAHDWLVPLWEARGVGAYGTYEGHNLHSFKVFGRINAAYKDIVALDARIDHRFGDKDRVDSFWYEWLDGARTVVGVSATVRPVRRLEITLGYEGRIDRRLMALQGGDGRQWHNLSAGAGYRITSQVSVFARFNNILGKPLYGYFLYPGSRLNGLFGATFKF